MSHNTHYIIINETDKDSAVRQADRALMEYGTEDNWYNIERVVDLDDLSEEDTKYLTIELEFLNQEISQSKVKDVTDKIERMQAQLDSGNRELYWQLSQHYKTLYELTRHTNKEPYTIEDLKDINDYSGWEFDEYGITNIENDVENSHVFFIEVNMHS